ncbi:hypothetical protein GQ457_15G019930 [Hibiscus cannabinus]
MAKKRRKMVLHHLQTSYNHQRWMVLWLSLSLRIPVAYLSIDTQGEYRYPMGGEAYSQWRNVMKYCIQAQDFELWDIIEEGYIKAPKKKKKQRSENDTKAKLNSRAMHILLCGLNEEVSKKVSTCKRAKEMWEKLERLYGKEEKKDGAPSCANLLQSSKVDGVVALIEPKVSSKSSVLEQMASKAKCGNALTTQGKEMGNL